LHSTLKTGLEPIINKDTKVLILGSFPSEKSLETKQYYANPGNQFWKLISENLETNLTSKPYKKRIRELLKNGIGLWDMIESCEREGSTDKKNKKPKTEQFYKY